jgi:hypothetical protein
MILKSLLHIQHLAAVDLDTLACTAMKIPLNLDTNSQLKNTKSKEHGERIQQVVKASMENQSEIYIGWEKLNRRLKNHRLMSRYNTMVATKPWSNIPSPAMFNPLKTKCRLLNLKTQSVPHSKHFSSQL